MALNRYLYARQKKKTLKALLGKETDPIKKEKLSTQLDLASRKELKQLEELQKAKKLGEEKMKTLTPEEKEEVKSKEIAFKAKLDAIKNRNISMQIQH